MWFDGHLDFPYLADHGRDLRRSPEDCGGSLQPAGITFPSLRAAEIRWAVGTLFVRKRRNLPADDGPWSFDTPDEAHAAALRQLDLYETWQRDGLLQIAGADSAPPPATPAPLTLLLAMEGAAALRSLDDLPAFVNRGLRIVGLAWAEGSAWAGGDQSGGDLTSAGRELVRALDRHRLIHDVSHLSEAAFWSLLGEARGPVIASHSNCRALLPGRKHPERHLSDAQIRALAAAGGVIGVNLFGRFLVEDAQAAAGGKRATIGDVVRHAEHLAQIAGRRDCVALGSDADSGFSTELLPAGLERPEVWPVLAGALSDAGWSDDELEGFKWRNWTRVLLGGRSPKA